MAANKTVSVQLLLDYANKQLERTDDDATKDYKAGICEMIQKVLHTCNGYEGFRFLNSDNMEFDTPGYFSRRYYLPKS